MKQRLLSLLMVLLGYIAGAQAQGEWISVGGVNLEPGNTYTSGDLSALTKGTITFTDAKHIIFDDVKLYYSCTDPNIREGVVETNIDGLVVTLVGSNHFYAWSYAYGIGCNNITFNGPGTLEIQSDASGVILGYEATLTNETWIDIWTEEYGIEGWDSSISMNSPAVLHFTGEATCLKDISSISGDAVVTISDGATFSASKKSVVDSNENPIKGDLTIEVTIDINKTNFPDENFRNHIYDLAGDVWKFTSTDIWKNRNINCSGKEIKDLTGIEFFKNMTSLDCSENSLETLDVSIFPELTSLRCYDNQLTSLDVSKNTALVNLNCGGNQLTSLDVSKNTALESLVCGSNQLTTLDLSKNTKLDFLNICDNAIFGKSTDALINSLPTVTEGSLRAFDKDLPGGDNRVTPEQVAAAKKKGWTVHKYNGSEWEEYAGEYLPINTKNFPDSNFRKFLKNMAYQSSGNEDANVLTDEDLAVTELDVSSWGIADLTGIELFTELEDLNCCTNNLKDLDVSMLTKLKDLNCSGNQLTKLDVSKNTALTSVDCSKNNIKGDGMKALVTKLPRAEAGGKLYICSIEENQPDDNVITRSQVQTANFNGWSVYKYDYTMADNWYEYAGDVPVDEVYFPDDNFRNYILAQDYGKDKLLSDKDIAGVKNILVSDKGITDLTGIGYFTALEQLYCEKNKLTSLDLSENTALKGLVCNDNLLEDINVSKNTALIALNCSNNRLSSLDVSKNTALVSLLCNGNAIRYSKMGNLVEGLPTKSEASMYVYKNEGDTGNKISTVQVAAATAKGWKVLKYDEATEKWVDYEGSAPGLAVTETDFPDENFRNYLMNRSGDGFFDEEELENFESITVNNENIASLKGIEYFTSLTTLSCRKNQLTTIDVTGLTKLNKIECYWNAIRGAGAQAFINSLPTVENGLLFFHHTESETGNELTTVQVDAAKAKGWKVSMYFDDDIHSPSWIDYEGVDPGLAIDETTFPDVNFRNWLLAQDYGYDGYLSDTEINEVARIDVPSQGIANLKGVELFTKLASLTCNDNLLTTLDVSSNPSLSFLDCSGNVLTTLDVTNNPTLVYLYCTANQLETIDVSKNPGLSQLFCYDNAIRGEGMEALINSLPTTTNGKLGIHNSGSSDDRNKMTADQVAAAKAKGWTAQIWTDAGWEDFEGDEEKADVTEVQVSIAKSGKTTLTSAYALDFSGFEDLKAYVATGYESDGTIWLTRIKLVPANTPVFIKGKADETYEVPVLDKCDAYFENMFKGSADENMTISATTADGKYKNFYMSSGQFKPASENYTLKAGKCYLQVPATFNAAVSGENQTVKIADSGKSSYAPPVDVDLTDVEGLKAYAATGYDAAASTIWLTRINKIHTGEGVLLKGEAGKTYTLPSTAVQACYGNMIIGNIGEKITINEISDDGEWTNYYLASGSFKKVNGTREIGTNKSYLQLPTSLLVSSARGKNTAGIDEWFMEELETETLLLGSIGGDDEDGTTRIDAIANDNAQPDVYYNLQGQRVDTPKKGLYIRNGKKVIVK